MLAREREKERGSGSARLSTIITRDYNGGARVFARNVAVKWQLMVPRLITIINIICMRRFMSRVLTDSDHVAFRGMHREWSALQRRELPPT